MLLRPISCFVSNSDQGTIFVPEMGGGGVSISLNKESNDLYQNTKFLILFLKIMVYFDEEINVLQKLYQTLLRFAVWIKNSQWRFI